MDELEQFIEVVRQDIEQRFTGDLKTFWLQILAHEAQRIHQEDRDGVASLKD